MAYSSSGNSIQKTSPVVINLIIINVIVFVIQYLFDGPYETVSGKLAIHGLHSQFFEPWQLLTNMFAHGGFAHIAFNMFALFTFGTWLERVWGSKRFLIFYLICGLVAGATEMLVLKDVVVFDQLAGENRLQVGAALGASGAIMGVFAAFAYLFPNTPLYIFFIPIPIKAKYAVVLMVLIDLFGEFGPYKTGIAHFAHLSGLAAGFVMVLIWNKTNRKTFY